MSSDSDEDIELFPYDPFPEEVSLFNYQDPLINSTILQAVLLNDTGKVEELVTAGNSLNVVDNNGNTALHLAVLKNSVDMVGLLIKLDINVENRNYMGNAPLHLALKHQAVDAIIIQLVKACRDVNIKNNMEETALHLSIRYSSPEIVQLLIERGADINAQDGSLYTPLHEAVNNKNFLVVCMLLFYNADPSFLCHNGLTPFMLSLTKPEAYEITELLFLYYDDFLNVTFAGESTFNLAVRYCSPIINDLINAGIECGYSSCDFITVLRFVLSINTFNLYKLAILGIAEFYDDSLFDDIIRNLCKMKYLSVELWLKCFYFLIEVAFDNLFEYAPKPSSVLVFILQYLYNEKVDLNTRKSVLWSYLSLGFSIGNNEISTCFDFFGNEDEAEILFQSYFIKNNPVCLNVPLSFFVCIILFYFEKRYFDFYIKECYLQHLSHKIKYSHRSNYRCLYLGYMSFPSILLPTLREYEYLIWERVSKLSNVPSLLELSRNATAWHIAEQYELKYPYQYFDIIKQANVPKLVKDLLLFKTPVYRI